MKKLPGSSSFVDRFRCTKWKSSSKFAAVAAASSLCAWLLSSSAGAWRSDTSAPPLNEHSVLKVEPAGRTEPVANDADDPAIWLHPSNPGESLIIGTDKHEAPGGGLYVYGLNGKVRQVVSDLDRPNNVDVEYGLQLMGTRRDVVVVTERKKLRLRVFAIDPKTGTLSCVTGDTQVFRGESGEAREPMGIALYKRSSDSAVFAIVSRKTGPNGSYLWQYRLQDDGTGKVKAVKVREFGRFSGSGEIEAVAVDDALGYVYYSDEKFGIRKYHANPDLPNADKELAVFGKESFQGDREGIAIYARPDGTGFIVCSDQRKGNSAFRIFKREGEPGKPHEHREVAAVFGGADDTDGIEIISRSLGSGFPRGLLVAMNSGPKNFLLFDWREIERVLPNSAERASKVSSSKTNATSRWRSKGK